MTKPIKELPYEKRIHAKFYATESGNEPVKESLLELGRPIKTVVGEDIRFVELNWRVDKPYVDRLRSGRGELEETIYEVRHTVMRNEFRTLFFCLRFNDDLGSHLQEENSEDAQVGFGFGMGSNEEMGSHTKRL